MEPQATRLAEKGVMAKAAPQTLASRNNMVNIEMGVQSPGQTRGAKECKRSQNRGKRANTPLSLGVEEFDVFWATSTASRSVPAVPSLSFLCSIVTVYHQRLRDEVYRTYCRCGSARTTGRRIR